MRRGLILRVAYCAVALRHPQDHTEPHASRHTRHMHARTISTPLQPRTNAAALQQLYSSCMQQLYHMFSSSCIPERVVKRDLRQVGRELLEVDVLGATALQRLAGAADAAGGKKRRGRQFWRQCWSSTL